ncbi:hypothetical protein QFC19_008983 [Naganishia cerealis]|uniref:Uncharacterized protein n=1 Tax=Naganishia cerealis TaxID=610337 RepID=A0ACC2UY37_9TREE|nr:hypothetical protein QFC19_008983 [Naganishia cerealis]
MSSRTKASSRSTATVATAKRAILIDHGPEQGGPSFKGPSAEGRPFKGTSAFHLQPIAFRTAVVQLDSTRLTVPACGTLDIPRETIMPPRKRTAQPQHIHETEASPDPLQITADIVTAPTDSPASVRRSARSRKQLEQAETPGKGIIQADETPAKATTRKRALPADENAAPSKDEGKKTSKRAKVEAVAAIDTTKANVPNESAGGIDDSHEPAASQGSATPTKKGKGPSRKTPASDNSLKSGPAVPSKSPSTRRKTTRPEQLKDAGKKATSSTPARTKLARSSAIPIRHSSNPLDDEQQPVPDVVETGTVNDVGEIKDIESADSRMGAAAFDLTSEQSREAFLRNERWQRAKEARNFNFEGDVNEGRRLRSGKGVTAVEVETSEADDTEDDQRDDAGDDQDDPMLDDEERQRQRAAKGKGKEQDVGFEPDNDYLSQLTYDTSMPIEAQKSTLIVSNDLAGREPTLQGDLTSRPTALTPFAKKVLKTVVSNLACTTTHVSSIPPTPDEEKNEALMQLVNLLTGTVERGEGNSCLVLGAKGSGKTRTVGRAVSIVRNNVAEYPMNGHSNGSSSTKQDRRPILVRLDGLAQTNDMLAIREMGRQIAIGEGQKPNEGDDDDDEDEAAAQAAEHAAPTTLPAHLLAHLTAPSARAIIIVIENFDLFTTHARQALLYCLLDVVQGVRTGPVSSTGRGVAVIGVTSRMWESQVENVLQDQAVIAGLQRICDLTTDVRLLLRPFITPVQQFALNNAGAKLDPAMLVTSIREQIHSTGWGKKLEKLQGLSHPSLVILIIAKHFAYAGKEEFNLAMVEHEYQRFARTQLAGSGRARWSTGILEVAWTHLMQVGLIFPATRFRPSTNPYMQRFIMCRALLSRNEIIAYFKGEGGKILGTELTGWGRTAGGHA